MTKTYIFGHKNPDTDSICSSIAMSNLRKNHSFFYFDFVIKKLFIRDNV